MSGNRYRSKALLCEKRARAVADNELRREWEELAIEWHLIAGAAEGASRDDVEFG